MILERKLCGHGFQLKNHADFLVQVVPDLSSEPKSMSRILGFIPVKSCSVAKREVEKTPHESGPIALPKAWRGKVRKKIFIGNQATIIFILG